jgi:hypothetical protein
MRAPENRIGGSGFWSRYSKQLHHRDSVTIMRHSNVNFFDRTANQPRCDGKANTSQHLM